MAPSLVLNVNKSGKRIVHRDTCRTIRHQVERAMWPDCFMDEPPDEEYLARSGTFTYEPLFITADELRSVVRYRACGHCKPEIEDEADK